MDRLDALEIKSEGVGEVETGCRGSCDTTKFAPTKFLLGEGPILHFGGLAPSGLGPILIQ